MRPFDIHDLIEETIELLAERATSKGLELGWQIDDHVPRLLCGDVSRLRQVLMNLVGNALKFTNQGDVSVNITSTNAGEGAVELRFEVRDTGPGIAPEVQQRLFAAFTQADASTSRKFGGTGLGLAISRQLIELMGGEIGVESALGAGSTFWFRIRLPLANDDESVCELDLQHRRILVVDDNQTNRKLLRYLAHSWGMASTEVSGANEALTLLSANSEAFDVAIIDFQMPGIDGLQLARELQSAPSTAKLPLILLTSLGWQYSSPTPPGITALLTKPVRRARLRRTLQTLIGRRFEADGRSPIADTGKRIQSDPESRVTHGSILLTEDNVVNQRLAKRFLEKLGYKVDVACNGNEAVAALHRRPYLLVLMDCQMPIADGFEATRQIRRLEAPRNRTPIVAMTANAMAGIAGVALKLE